MLSPALTEIESMFGPSGRALFLRALTRRAWLSESGRPVAADNHHEALEFLGDAWLGAIVATRVFRDFASADEKELTRTREALVDTETLAEIGRELELPDVLQAGVGEVKQAQIRTEKVLASHVEALIGAMYLHGGPDGAERLVNLLLHTRWRSQPIADRVQDAKGELARIIQASLRDASSVPTYRQVERRGADHHPIFVAAVDLPDGRSFEGDGAPTLKEAEQKAARVALDSV